MIEIPEPLHPAVVHFPIAFIVVGAAVSLLTLFLQRWHLRWFTAGLLIIGALGTMAGVFTGKLAEKAAGRVPSTIEHHVEEHEEWAEKTRTLAIVTALVAIVAASLARFPKISTFVSLFTTVGALAAAYAIYQTGRSGAKLVYDFGMGVTSPAIITTTSLPIKTESQEPSPPEVDGVPGETACAH